MTLMTGPSQSRAAVIYSVPESVYSQNFDTLPTTPLNASLGASPIGWKNDDAAPGAGNFSILGWYLFHPAALAEGGFDGHQRMRIGAGTANTGAFMSFGNSADRAMGSLASNTTAAVGSNHYIGLRLTNTVGYTLTEFTISFDGEQWRDGGAAVPFSETMTLQYSTSATAINDTPAYSPVTGADFVTPVFTNTGSGAAVDGNVAGKTSIGPVTVTGVGWADGTDLWLRWIDPSVNGNDHGMGIDNVSFAAAPEPASMALLVIAGAGLIARRRRI